MKTGRSLMDFDLPCKTPNLNSQICLSCIKENRRHKHHDTPIQRMRTLPYYLGAIEVVNFISHTVGHL